MHLVYYHTEHPGAGLFDFLMSHKALSKWKITGRCLASMKCSGKGGVVGERRSVEQIQSLTLEVRTRVNIDLNLHVATLTLFYANMTPTGLYAVIK